MFRVQKDGGDTRAVEGFQQFGFGGSPFVGIAAALGDEFGYRAAGHRSGGLYEHL